MNLTAVISEAQSDRECVTQHCSIAPSGDIKNLNLFLTVLYQHNDAVATRTQTPSNASTVPVFVTLPSCGCKFVALFINRIYCILLSSPPGK